MSQVPRKATLYRDTGRSGRGGSRILTRTSGQMPPAQALRGQRIDIHTGNLWCAGMRDLTRHNEAYLELTAVSGEDIGTPVPHSFKQKVDVADRSFSEMLQARQVLSGIEVKGNGITLNCRLTELDRLDEKKFAAIKAYVDTNDIAGKSEALLNLNGMPFNPRDLVKTLSESVALLDTLNDDDRIWREAPKLDLRDSAQAHLYEGWYAFVTEPATSRHGIHPTRLHLSNGMLYTTFRSDGDNEPFTAATYLTLQVLRSTLPAA